MRRRLPPLEELLADGGDGRIMRDAEGRNKYGCFSTPRPDIRAYGSCTASTISQEGYDAAARLYETLSDEAPEIAYARMRREILGLCQLADVTPDILFGASGTDVHLLIAQLFRAAYPSLLIIMPEAAETGRGVPAALQARHFSDRTAQGAAVVAGEAAGEAVEVVIADAELEAQVMRAIEAGRHVLIVLADVSKSGRILPGLSCVLGLKRRFGDSVDILVDGCQFRLSNATLRAYLDEGCLLAVTGSKFITGPAFSAALMIPQAVAQRMRGYALPKALGLYSVQAEWPEGWRAREGLPAGANEGLLLRLEAALTQWRAFRALPEDSVAAFLEAFAAAVTRRLAEDPLFEPVAVVALSREALGVSASWDCIQTIFPFMLRRSAGGRLCNAQEMAAIYARMSEDASAHPAIPESQRVLAGLRFQLGQPIDCGEGHSALRLCADMRLLCAPGDRVMADAMRLLDKAALLAQYTL